MINTRPGSDTCWEQAVFPLHFDKQCVREDKIEIEFLVKEHVRLLNREGGEYQKIPNEIFCSLNHKKSCQTVFPEKVEKILDFTTIPLQSLNILKMEPKAQLTMFMSQTDSTKCKVDLVTEIATNNGIDLSRIDGISKVSSDESYDLVFLDPVLQSGRLDSKLLRQLDESKLSTKYFSPNKLTIWISLIESEELIKNYKMLPTNDLTMGFQMVNCSYSIILH